MTKAIHNNKSRRYRESSETASYRAKGGIGRVALVLFAGTRRDGTLQLSRRDSPTALLASHRRVQSHTLETGRWRSRGQAGEAVTVVVVRRVRSPRHEQPRTLLSWGVEEARSRAEWDGRGRGGHGQRLERVAFKPRQQRCSLS